VASAEPVAVPTEATSALEPEVSVVTELEKPLQSAQSFETSPSGKFYSPLVKSIAQAENISTAELDNIQGSGKEGRVTKEDILKFIEDKKSGKISGSVQAQTRVSEPVQPKPQPVMISGEDEIIEMDRMRKMIAQNMVASKQIAPHVTSFIEADVTNIVLWREKNKDEFQKKNGEKITFMPIFIEAIAKAIKDFPMINVSVDGDRIIKKKNINIGMAAALPSG